MHHADYTVCTLALTSKNYFIDNLVVWSFSSLTISASVQMYICTKSCILYLICRLLLTSFMVYLHSTYFLHIKCVESYYRYNENLTWTFRTHAKNIALPWCPKVNRSNLLGMRLNDDFQLWRHKYWTLLNATYVDLLGIIPRIVELPFQRHWQVTYN